MSVLFIQTGAQSQDGQDDRYRGEDCVFRCNSRSEITYKIDCEIGRDDPYADTRSPTVEAHADIAQAQRHHQQEHQGDEQSDGLFDNEFGGVDYLAAQDDLSRYNSRKRTHVKNR